MSPRILARCALWLWCLERVLESAHTGTPFPLVAERTPRNLSGSRLALQLPCLSPEVEAQNQVVVALDPLDGSSNLDCAAPTGTIFGIWARNGTQPFTQPGAALLAAGYVRPHAQSRNGVRSDCLSVHSKNSKPKRDATGTEPPHASGHTLCRPCPSLSR